MLCKNTTKYNTFMRKRQHLTNMPFSGSWHSRNSAKNGKMCQNMFLSTIEGTLAEFDVTQRENDTRRPDRNRCDPVVGNMSRKAWRRNDAYNAELLRTCLAPFFKQAQHVRKRWKKNPRLSGNYVALCRGNPADIKKMRAERFELPTF